MLFSFRSLVIGSLLLVALSLEGQEADHIFLRNPSFEDMPRNSAAPKGWTDCGFMGESPPDVHPDPQFEFHVSKPAQHGATYLGMVTRENETYESVGQQLTQPLSAEQCYVFSIQLARSEVYLSRSRKTNQPSNYVTPIKLMIYGGYSTCDKRELLGQSALVRNYDWEEYRFRLRATAPYTHIVLVAYYKQPSMFPYNGNILLDNAQPLRPIDCAEDLWADPPVAELAAATEVTEPIRNPEEDIQTEAVPQPRSVPAPPAPDPAPPVSMPETTPESPTVRLGRTETVLRENAIFAVEDIVFKANSAELEDTSRESLEEIVGFLKTYDNVIVEIGGHANLMASSYTATALSEDRARSVISYLRGRSIGFDRLLPRGYGKSRPVCQEKTPACNRKNQRVEIRILKIKT